MSILSDVRSYCIGDDTCTAFDTELKDHINMAFSELNQIGVGPSSPYKIETGNETWNDFSVATNMKNYIPEYIKLTVKNIFDPSPNKNLYEVASQKIDEIIFRLQIEVERNQT